MKTPLSILRAYWKFDAFRPLQKEIIGSVLAKKDTLALLPTGGGKSVCFQVPALAMDGLCLVISPLIALMKDQVENLRRKGITALSLHSGLSRKEVITTLKIASDSNCKFLYVSPERLQTSLFKEYLPGLNVQLIAVDEAHCISQWGYDFRPPYLRIAELRKELPDVPILALTASATPQVQKDICEKLEFNSPSIFRQSFERPNLSYSIFEVDSKVNKLLEILNNVPGSSIVYCRSRKHTKEIAGLLKLHGIVADHYHAGLTSAERNERQQRWINDQVRVMVCTNAFGMGIDKPNVRTVVHIDLPDSLEYYYQEAGRAGRDGNRSYAVLLFHKQELAELNALPDIHYPSLEKIREVYQALMNFLQLPSGSGKENYYEFDLKDFVGKFSFDIQLVINTLRVLEQEEIIGLNEQVFLPSTVQFTASRSRLQEFEITHPSYDSVVKTLLRTYEGIYDFPTSINERFVASTLKTDEQFVKQQLAHLNGMKILEYSPQKEKPQIYCYTDRVRTEDLHLNLQNLEKRKQAYTDRIIAMEKYILEHRACRSSFIGKYFGDDNVKACGICDNCLHQKPVSLNETEFVDIHMRLLKLLQRPLHSNDIIKQLKGIRKEKAWKVIDHLQSENKIEVDANGWIKKVQQ
jgi:ATP-dependent DNA helicase RecQ